MAPPPEVRWWEKAMGYLPEGLRVPKVDICRDPGGHLVPPTNHSTDEDTGHREGNCFFIFVNSLFLPAIDERT